VIRKTLSKPLCRGEEEGCEGMGGDMEAPSSHPPADAVNIQFYNNYIATSSKAELNMSRISITINRS